MGGPVCYRVLLPKPLMALFLIQDYACYALSLFLLRLGIPTPLEYPLLSLSSQANEDHAGHSPSSTIKSQLGSIQLRNLLLQAHDKYKHDRYFECAVCMCELKSSDEVRKLENCLHLFHKDCIDKWVDLRRFTCPMCRAPLLPKKKEKLAVKKFQN